MFIAQHICLLNPTFGEASGLVGGADADLVIDDMIIDIKVTKELTLSREYFDQIVGYYLLSIIAGIDGAPIDHEINQLGIYFARYGYLYKMDISSLGDQDTIMRFVEWFVGRAARETYYQKRLKERSDRGQNLDSLPPLLRRFLDD